MASLKNTLINDTGYLGLPSGTTAQRPSSPATGYMRWNTTESHAEVYNGTDWAPIGTAAAAVPLTVDYLVVAGGGSGSLQGAGGGGGLRTSYTLPTGNTGGGLTAESSLALATTTNYIVSVGPGGTDSYSSGGSSENGTNSKFGVIGSEIESTGGGGAGSTSGDAASATGKNGGSGGGAGANSNGSPGNGTTGQGYIGGTALFFGGSYAGGGGGGASGPGGNSASNTVAGNGGAQLNVAITGASIGYAGGGGGSLYGTGTVGTNDSSAGAAAPSSSSSASGGSAPVNLGGGGGGANHKSGTSNIFGGTGGSGVVILRYPDAYTISETTSPTVLTFTTATDGNDKVTTFTAGENGTIQFS